MEVPSLYTVMGILVAVLWIYCDKCACLPSMEIRGVASHAHLRCMGQPLILSRTVDETVDVLSLQWRIRSLPAMSAQCVTYVDNPVLSVISRNREALMHHCMRTLDACNLVQEVPVWTVL